jgi:hypothetical protein
LCFVFCEVGILNFGISGLFSYSEPNSGRFMFHTKRSPLNDFPESSLWWYRFLLYCIRTGLTQIPLPGPSSHADGIIDCSTCTRHRPRVACFIHSVHTAHHHVQSRLHYLSNQVHTFQADVLSPIIPPCDEDEKNKTIIKAM